MGSPYPLAMAIAIVTAAVITIVGAQVGLPGRLLRITYIDRRVNALTKLLEKHEDKLTSKEIEDVEKEISYTLDEVLGTSGRTESERLQKWNQEWSQQHLLRRAFLLPLPRSTTGWILTVMSYAYLVGAIIYAMMLLCTWDIDFTEMVEVGFVGSLMFFVLLRGLSLMVVRRDLSMPRR